VTGAPDPQVRKQLVVDVFDRGAPEYDQLGVDFFTPAGRDLVAQVGIRPGERVLDVGCGRGAVLFAAADAVGPNGRVVGIDLSPRMAELTAADAAARGLTQVSVVQGDAERPDFAPSSFDAVLAGLVIFFLSDAEAALRAYAALLSAGGRLGLTTFAANDPVFDSAMRAAGSFVPDALPDRGDRQGPFGSVEMGGMFTVMKVREGLAPNDYKDPGPYKNPPGTVAYEVNVAQAGEPPRQPGPSESPGMDMPGMDMPGMVMPDLEKWGMGTAALVFIMWTVMMVAMMVPSATLSAAKSVVVPWRT